MIYRLWVTLPKPERPACKPLIRSLHPGLEPNDRSYKYQLLTRTHGSWFEVVPKAELDKAQKRIEELEAKLSDQIMVIRESRGLL